jgi:hypothetical protein
MQTNESRTAYLVNQEAKDTAPLWEILMEVVRPGASEVFIDAHPSPDWPGFGDLPIRVKEAHEALERLALSRGRTRGNILAITLNQEEIASHWQALVDYGPHSIYVDVFGDHVSEEPILHNSDSGDFMARLTDAEMAQASTRATTRGIRLDDICEKWVRRPPLWRRILGMAR